jgi:type II secretory pathway pseudopilin PulG
MLPDRQRGLAYLYVLLAVFLLALGVEHAVDTVAYDRQREREEELIEVGRMYRAAIGAYYESTPSGRKAYPNQLEDLLRDPRHAITRRYMRRLPVDPLTARDFVPLVSPQGGIWGVASSSAARPLREAQPPDLLIPSLRHGGYRDWMFVYVPPS